MQPPTRYLLEVCIASVEDAIAAAVGGADRLELNLALELGGLTPSLGLLAEVKRAVSLPIIAMVRPRAGDFCFSRREQTVMLRDAELLLAHEADGLACGALDAQGEIDLAFWSEFIQFAGERETVFHRAFDELQNQPRALEALIELGATRVLTSGAAATAWEGAEQLAQLAKQANGRIEILPAAGISAAGVAPLVHATGCRQIHGSFRDPQSPWPRTSSLRVRAARAALDAI